MSTPFSLPLEILFNLLSLARRAASTRALQRQLQNRQLYYGTLEETPGFGFWLKLALAADLLYEGDPPRPTPLVSEWLEMSLESRWLHLLEAWMTAPVSLRNQDARLHLLTHLFNDGELSSTEQREIGGLRALGLAHGERLSPEAHTLLAGKLLELPPPNPWHWNGDHLWVPYPPDYASLWELETYLDPVDPGVYSLDARALRKARQRALTLEQVDIVEKLPALLARGLNLSVEEASAGLGELAYALDDQPTVTMISGYLLTFSDSTELRRLRRVQRMQPFLDGVLSRHHLFLKQTQADPVLHWLSNHNILDVPVRPDGMTAQGLTRSEQVALLALLLFAEGAQAGLGTPSGLFTKLTTGLPLSVRAAAAQRAWKALEKIFPRPKWKTETEPPEMPEAEILLWLERAISHQTPIDFLYQKARGYRLEPRHVTPLLLEQRGLRFYLIAYCHTRRANRMFRLDRIRALG